jgi:hypothetical protein
MRLASVVDGDDGRSVRSLAVSAGIRVVVSDMRLPPRVIDEDFDGTVRSRWGDLTRCVVDESLFFLTS